MALNNFPVSRGREDERPWERDCIVDRAARSESRTAQKLSSRFQFFRGHIFSIPRNF